MRLTAATAGFLLFVFSAAPSFSQSSQAAASQGSAATVSESASGSLPSAPDIDSPNGEVICGIAHLGRCIKDLGEDDKAIFTSPMRLKARDRYWLLPLGAATGLAFAYDTDAEAEIGVDANRTKTANKIADLGSFYATGAEGAGIYFLGMVKKDPKLMETGRLGAEAVIDSGTVTLLTKLVSNRQRPLQGNGQGGFWADGTQHWEWDSSFPSDHATASMALARVVAGEYWHWYVGVPAYGFAEAVGISRIMANQHFPSDVLVGQAIGFLTGGYLLHHRAQYRGNWRETMADRVMDSVRPFSNARAHAIGVSVEIRFGQ